MKVTLCFNKPEDILHFISKTEYAGMVAYDKDRKCLIPIVEGLYVHFDPYHWVLEIKKIDNMYLGPTQKKANEISDEQLIKCMKDYLECPARYHPEYLQVLVNDYERRVAYKMDAPAPAGNMRQFANINTSKDV